MFVDSREPPHIISRLKKHFDDVTVKELSCGDVWIDDVIIERKTVGDLLASIADKRLLNQASDMRSLSERCYLVIEGPLIWYDSKIVGTKWHFRSVQGALLKVQELGVCVVHCSDDLDFIKTVEWLALKSKNKITILEPRTYGIPMIPAEKILTAIPGISLERATVLLKESDSVAVTLECLTDDRCPLPDGIEPKTRQAVRTAFGLASDEKIGRIKNERINSTNMENDTGNSTSDAGQPTFWSGQS